MVGNDTVKSSQGHISLCDNKCLKNSYCIKTSEYAIVKALFQVQS